MALAAILVTILNFEHEGVLRLLEGTVKISGTWIWAKSDSYSRNADYHWKSGCGCRDSSVKNGMGKG